MRTSGVQKLIESMLRKQGLEQRVPARWVEAWMRADCPDLSRLNVQQFEQLAATMLPLVMRSTAWENEQLVAATLPAPSSSRWSAVA